MARIEWAFRHDPRGLRAARRIYRKACADLFQILKSRFEERS
jgi:hypothetical protein